MISGVVVIGCNLSGSSGCGTKCSTSCVARLVGIAADKTASANFKFMLNLKLNNYGKES
jgi:hypothetical protein